MSNADKTDRTDSIASTDSVQTDRRSFLQLFTLGTAPLALSSCSSPFPSFSSAASAVGARSTQHLIMVYDPSKEKLDLFRINDLSKVHHEPATGAIIGIDSNGIRYDYKGKDKFKFAKIESMEQYFGIMSGDRYRLGETKIREAFTLLQLDGDEMFMQKAIKLGMRFRATGETEYAQLDVPTSAKVPVNSSLAPKAPTASVTPKSNASRPLAPASKSGPACPVTPSVVVNTQVNVAK